MANTTIAKIREGLISNSVDLGLYLQEKAKYHKNYKYYSSKETIQSICETNSILLSDGENWNDEADKKRMLHAGKSPRYFGFCFSYSISENVAMWMLYSQDNGCMIDFDRSAIESMMKVYEVEIGELKNGKFNPLDRLVVEDAGIKIQLSDVIYVGKTDDEKKNDEFYYVRRSSETNSEFNKKMIEDEFLFRKGLPWFYENECRLVFSVPEEKLSHYKRGFRLKLSFDKSIISRLRDKKRIYNSPNIESISKDPFYKDNSDSKLTDGINWKLKDQFCNSCPQNKI